MTAEATYRLPETDSSEKEAAAIRVVAKTIPWLCGGLKTEDTSMRSFNSEGIYAALRTALPLVSEAVVGKDYEEPQRVVELNERLAFNAGHGMNQDNSIWLSMVGRGGRRRADLGHPEEGERRSDEERRSHLDLDYEVQTQLRPFVIQTEGERPIQLEGKLFAVWYQKTPTRPPMAEMKPVLDPASVEKLYLQELALLEERAEAAEAGLKSR